MQGKGLIRFFAILIAVVCLFQYFLMWQTNKIEAKADEYAQVVATGEDGSVERYLSEKAGKSKYLDSISQDTVFRIPLLANYTYNDLKDATLNLGLDLKGGMSAALEVDLKELLITLANKSKDDNFRQALKDADELKKTNQSDYVTLFAEAYQKLANGKKMSKLFSINPSLRSQINAESTDAEVIAVLREKANSTVELTFDMLKERIDRLGVVQPNVTLDANRDLILVEMPGIENPERARRFLQQSAKLEFWNTYRSSDPGISAAFAQADQKATNLGLGGAEKPAEKIWGDFKYDITTGEKIDSSLVSVSAEDAGDGALFSMLTMYPPGSSQMGYVDRKKKDAVTKILNNPEISSVFPNDMMFLWSHKQEDTNIEGVGKKYILYGIKKGSAGASAPLEGDVVVGAEANPDPSTGEMGVSLTMNSKGAKTWGNITTTASANGNREVAIVLDSMVYSAPRVNQPITGGRSSITGNFSVQEATDLAKILSVGKLPAKTRIIQESTVGPSLGKENISRSIKSLLWGVGLLLLFMVFYYGGAGIISIIALLINVFFIFGALANFGTVLTIPGIAGIILTIGMAVDANVIIFERVREELRSGKTLLASIKDGFQHSYSAIIDANVTTILVALVLARFGLGPIKGFAVVLIIGVLLSLLTAVLLGKMFIDWWTVKKEKDITFWTPPVKNAFAKMNIDWIGKRKIAYVASGILIAAGLISIFTSGLNYGVDFKGGYQYEISFPSSYNITADGLRTGLTDYLEGTPVVKAVDKANTFNLTTDYLIDNTDEGNAKKVMLKLAEGITAISGQTFSAEAFELGASDDAPKILSSAVVGPTIADDIKKSSILAAIIALILIFAYIFIRFTKWQYSMGAIAALIHDTLVLLGIFSLLKNLLPFSLDIDQAFIAALLTVIGYSINDTVVVFDRIREYLGIYTSKTTDEVLNLAINSTFSRTIITSLTTLFVVTILLVFGGSSSKGFAFALFVGVLVGTYSSIFVATPVLRDLTSDLRPKVSKDSKKSVFSKAANG